MNKDPRSNFGGPPDYLQYVDDDIKKAFEHCWHNTAEPIQIQLLREAQKLNLLLNTLIIKLEQKELK